jgi:hypothetical protein
MARILFIALNRRVAFKNLIYLHLSGAKENASNERNGISKCSRDMASSARKVNARKEQAGIADTVEKRFYKSGFPL